MVDVIVNKIPDFSFWQDDPTTPQGIDFAQVAKKTNGVILRAGQGLFPDKTFQYNWQEAKKAGLSRGAYWYFDSRVAPKRQAEVFSSLLINDPPELRAWFDFEEEYGGEFTGWKHWYDLMANFERLAPNIEIGVYTGYYYWTEYTNIYLVVKPTTQQLAYFGRFPLWIAWYNPDPPKIPAPWSDWFMWQFTDDYPGSGWGVESHEIDMNYIKSDLNKASYITAKFGNVEVEYKHANI